MAKTTFIDTETVIEAEWLNEVNGAVFDAIGDGTDAPTTGAEVRTNIEAAKSGANSDITSLSGLTTPLSLSQGGTGANLVDPNADRIVFWDDSAGAIAFLTVGANLLLSDTSLTGNADMAYANARFKVGSFTRNVATASGTAAVTGVGFTPKAIIFGSGMTASSVGSCIGVDDGTTRGGFQFVSPNNFLSTAFSIYVAPTATSDYNTGIVSTFDVDGFTISWTKVGSPTGTATVWYLALR